MNELLAYREVKRVMRHGIPKHEAKSIVSAVIQISEGKHTDIERATNYAVDLRYGIGLTQIS